LSQQLKWTTVCIPAGKSAAAEVAPMSLETRLEKDMTLCPLALAVGCRKCPIFSICPLKSQIGDYLPEQKTGDKQGKK
jgi:hypothetical protein